MAKLWATWHSHLWLTECSICDWHNPVHGLTHTFNTWNTCRTFLKWRLSFQRLPQDTGCLTATVFIRMLPEGMSWVSANFHPPPIAWFIGPAKPMDKKHTLNCVSARTEQYLKEYHIAILMTVIAIICDSWYWREWYFCVLILIEKIIKMMWFLWGPVRNKGVFLNL